VNTLPTHEQAAYLALYQKLPLGQFSVIETDSSLVISSDDVRQFQFLIQHRLFPIWMMIGTPPLGPDFNIIEELPYQQIPFQSDVVTLYKDCITAIKKALIPIIVIPESVNRYDFIGAFIAHGHIHKWIYVTDTAPLLDSHNTSISFINLSSLTQESIHRDPSHYDRLLAYLDWGPRLPFCAMALTRFDDLIKEVFTVKGSGTYFAYHMIDYFPSPSEDILAKCVTTIEASFGRSLCSDYLNQSIKGVISQRDYQGCVVFLELDSDLIYIDKFAVRPLFRGTGLGKRLWLDLINQATNLIWRAAPDNPMNAFYQSQATFQVQQDNWIIYGIGDSDIIRKWIPKIALKASSFI